MDKCEVCGNIYDKIFSVQIHGEDHFFDCFECAIQALAPRCQHCGVAIVGHGVERDDQIFCGNHCLRQVTAKTTDLWSDSYPVI